ncbi:MAG TPA: group III truncated hemoglobin [Chitinophagaceae bacterium]|jgi:hemoglobin|nr:group III truncated hemoglobin [Chitinophagaceae bacterium]
MKKELESREDIELLVNTFYGSVKKNPVLRPIFEDIAKVDWPHHLPRMYAFWESVLFGEVAFKGNPMVAHIDLSRKTEMGGQQFDTWLAIWDQTVDTLFTGKKAIEAKQKAHNIAGLMLYKIQSNNKSSI